MPYSMKKRGDEYCVINSDTNESKGCSKTRKTALAHMRKLYSVEGKSLEEMEDLILKAAAEFQTKEGEVIEPEDLKVEKDYGYMDGEPIPYVPYGVTSYEGLEAQREAWKKEREVEEKIRLFPGLANSIMNAEEITDKAAAIQTLAAELADKIREASTKSESDDDKSLPEPVPPTEKATPSNKIAEIAEAVISRIKSLVKNDNDVDGDMMFFKDDEGRLMWLARYSNNFLDDDDPPDIISEKSHRRFVECVEKGVYPYPELQVWHEKSWSLGQAVWCAYDDAGFAIAAGYVRPECEPIARKFAQLKARGVSHGMPIESIVRDPEDPRVIIEHQTEEISLLPVWGAANKLTSFDIFGKDGMEDDTMIPKDKKKTLIDRWGVSPDTLDALESINSKTAAKAAEVGLEKKEAPEVDPAKTETPAETTPAPEETKGAPTAEADTPEKPGEESQDFPPTRTEIAEALAPILNAQTEAIKALNEKVDGLTKELAEVKTAKAQEKSLAEQIFSKSPVASLMALYGNDRSVGAEEAKVKEGELENKPKETSAPVEGRTGIPMIDAFLNKQPE